MSGLDVEALLDSTASSKEQAAKAATPNGDSPRNGTRSSHHGRDRSRDRGSGSRTCTASAIGAIGNAAAAAPAIHQVRMKKIPPEVRLAVTRVGVGAGAVILIADTHAVIEETEISTAAATVLGLARSLPIATIAPGR